jgi:hypothetical protein
LKYRVARDGSPILNQFSEAGFVDCFLRIAARVDHRDHHELDLLASYKRRRIGFKVLVRKGIRGAFDGEANLIAAHVYRSGIEFRRTGPESDSLVVSVAELYKLSTPSPARMVDRIAFTGIALHEDGDVDMAVDPIKIKLFAYDREDDPQDRYFESFFNLDLKNGFVYWNEKDQEYRSALLRGLAMPSRN